MIIEPAAFDALYSGLTKALDAYYVPEGGSFQIKGEVARLRELVEKRQPRSIMEIGFNTGHSALLFLAITPPETKVVSFDLGEYAHVFAAKRYIDKHFPGRHTLVTGDSTQTIPNYEEQVAHRMKSKNPPPLTFDFIFVDGGHQNDIPEKDLINSYRLITDENNVVAIDDISRDPSRQMHYTIQPTKAWADMVKMGIIREDGYDDYFLTDVCPDGCNARGLAWGSYLFDINKQNSETSSQNNRSEMIQKLKYTQLQNDYKYMTRDQMVKEIDHLYHAKREHDRLVALSDLYLEYFENYNKRDTNFIRFYRAAGNFVINKPLAMKQYEQVIDTPKPTDPEEMPDYIRFYSVCNLGTLYPMDSCPSIPKIIHLLFFGETEFFNFHHRCVHSMIQYMPDYEIRIHSAKEPVNNKYWDDLKKQPTVKIVKIDVPQFFDGFELKHFQYKADVVRLEVLYEQGGVYLDLDMLIVKPFHEVFNSGHSFYISKERTGHDCLINAFLAAKPKNEFIKIWLNEFKSGLRLGIWAHHIRDSNKKLLDEHPHYEHKYRIKILEGDVFMPFHWQDTEAFLRSETHDYEFKEGSYGTHLWETILGDVMIKNRFLKKQKLELTIYKDKSSQFYDYMDSLVASSDYFNDFRNDQFVNEFITKGKRNGYFIEIGACDGKECSSCYYFEKNLNWSGLAVEPARCYSNNLKACRKNPVTLAVSNVTSLGSNENWNRTENGSLFYETDLKVLSGLKSALETNKAGQDWTMMGHHDYMVDTITLYDLCCQYKSPEYIDYCAIDCGGSEYDILSTFFAENRDNTTNNMLYNSDSNNEIGLSVSNKVFHIDVFSIEINNNYDKIRHLMETNDYEEVFNPFLKIMNFNGREVTWEKYFKHKNTNSPQLSQCSSISSTSSSSSSSLNGSLSTFSSCADTPQAVQTPPTSPDSQYRENDGVITVSTPVPNAGFIIQPPFAAEFVAICLEERPERTKYVSNHLLLHGVKHTILLNNIHPTNTKVGCFRSHIKAIRYAKNKNLSSVLIVEDDIVIRDNITELATLQFPNGKDDWDILYFGGILTKFDNMDSTGKWVKGTIWCNHAYLVKQHMYKPILDFVDSYPDLDELEGKNIDAMYTEYIQPKYKCWLAYDQYIIQKEGYSEIDGRNKWTNEFDWSTFSMKIV
jgi:FkbM family methyltransferase